MGLADWTGQSDKYGLKWARLSAAHLRILFMAWNLRLELKMQDGVTGPILQCYMCWYLVCAGACKPHHGHLWQ